MKMAKLFLVVAFLLSTFTSVHAQELQKIKLSSPDMDRGASIMKALSLRQTARDTSKWSDKELSLKDLSDLLWAANGINRPDSQKRTAASAMNAQDVDIYVFTKAGVYLYDAAEHALNPVAAGDHRSDIGMKMGGGPGPSGPPPGAPAGAAGPGQAGGQATGPQQGQGAPAGEMGAGRGGAMTSFDYPLELLLVSENARFRIGTTEKKFEWGCIDTGLVAQNIMLFCSGNGLLTHPKAAIDEAKMKTLLKLTDTQHVLLVLPVGYAKE